MPIRVSTARHVDALIADLGADDDVARDAAVARLTVIGERAVDRLVSLVADIGAPPSARAAAFRALEAIHDPRALAPALAQLRPAADRRRQVAAEAVADTAVDEVAVAAAGVARAFLTSDVGLQALDVLTAAALDGGRSDVVREAAWHALASLDAGTLRPVRDTLLTDASPRLRALAQGLLDTDERPPATGRWLDAAGDHPLPEDADVVRHEVARRGSTLPLPWLHRALERVREREAAVPADAQPAWAAARGAIHLALARRGSRVALYDLRELIAGHGTPSSDLLAAAGVIGDASCLEPLLDAYTRVAVAAGGDGWHRHVIAAAHAIVVRERLTARHAVGRKVKKRWPELWAAVVEGA